MRSVNLVELTAMEKINFTAMYAMNQRWRGGHIFTMSEPRGKTAFLWLSGCSVTARPHGGTPIHFKQNSLICIPEGSVYSLEFHDCSEERTNVLIDVCLSDGEPLTVSDSIYTVTDEVDEGLSSLIEKLVISFSKPLKNYLEIKSYLYKFLSTLAKIESKTIIRENFASIEKGIKYLESDESQTLSLEEVAKMCFVTPAYFRRVFRRYAGMPPSEYRNVKKTERAKDLLINSDYSIEEIADLLSFESPSYFCRVFKKCEGMSPSAFRKKNISIEK